MKKQLKNDNQLTLFGDPAPKSPVMPDIVSMPLRQLYEYCAMRDRQSAAETDEDEPERKQWFLKRAADYEQLAKECAE